MIYIDVDGVLVDFVGTAKKHFGIEMEHNVFGKWTWGAAGYPTPEEFYAVAEPQPWLHELMDCFRKMQSDFITKDFADVKHIWLYNNITFPSDVVEAPAGKAAFCKHPCDLLIDDNPAECEAWMAKGGIAYWFNLAEQDPFGKFLKWWRMEK
jgi:hypothetical protein